MHYLSQVLERVRKLLFVRRTAHGAVHTGPVAAARPELAARCLSPVMLHVALARARHRRAPHQWPSIRPLACVDGPGLGDPVRVYVLLPEERAHMLVSPAGEAR